MLRFEAPTLARFPGLTLPDRNGQLERIDRETSRFEGITAVRRRRHHNNCALTERQTPLAVKEHKATERWPPAACLGSEIDETRLHLRFVRLVLEERHSRPILGVIARVPRERHHSTAGIQNGPGQRTFDRQWIRAQPNPVGGIGRRQHAVMVREIPRSFDLGAAAGESDTVIATVERR